MPTDTQPGDHKDPYAEGKAIANPEPNNGQGVKDSELDPTEQPEEAPTDGSAKDAGEDDMSADESAPDEDAEEPTPEGGSTYDPDSQPSADER